MAFEDVYIVRDFFGSVYCGSHRLTGSHMPAMLSYATSRRTPHLRELRTYFEELQDAIRL
jgi:hypothetical protein